MPLCRVLLLSLPLAGACGPKASTTPVAAGSETTTGAPGAATLSMPLPGGPDAKKFAQNLVDAEIADFKPAGVGGSVQFVYESLDFSGDGSWTAKAAVEANFESIPCVESGSWTIEDAESATAGTITWTVARTNCAMREAGETTRGAVTLGKGTGFSVAFR